MDAVTGRTHLVYLATPNNPTGVAAEVADVERVAAAFDARNIERVPSEGNFILARVGDGARVTRELMKRGVIVRPVGNYGLMEWIRVTVGLPAQNERFFAELDPVLAADTTSNGLPR